MTTEEITKTCTKCGTPKPLSEFPNQKGQRYDKAPQCKACASAYQKQYYAEHREQIRVTTAAYAKKHPEVVNRSRKKYAAANIDKRRAARESQNLTPKQREQKAATARKVKASNPLHSLFIHTRSRAKMSKIPFTIEEVDIPVEDFCPILGIPMFWSPDSRTDNTPSIDKLIPELGYTTGNVFIVSQRANTLKCDGTAEEHRKIADWMEDQIIFSPTKATKEEFKAQTEEMQKRSRKVIDIARSRSRKNKTEFSLSNEEVTIPAVCPVLGIPLVFAKGFASNNSPSLDKIQDDLGYISGNVAVISWRANRIKNTGTAAEHRLIADWIDAQTQLPLAA